MRFEGTTLKPPADLKSIRVSAGPAESQRNVYFAPAGVAIGPDGRFVMSGVTPGRYRLTASFPGSGRPGGWVVKSVMVGGQDSLDAPFTLPPNQHVLDATITFSDRLAEVSGTVRDAVGGAATDYTVVLFPAEPSLWVAQSRRIQGVRPAADGAYLVRNLPAGNYLIAAVNDVEPGEWFDPAFLQRLVPAAVRITIADGEQTVQEVRIGGGQSFARGATVEDGNLVARGDQPVRPGTLRVSAHRSYQTTRRTHRTSANKIEGAHVYYNSRRCSRYGTRSFDRLRPPPDHLIVVGYLYSST